MNNPTAASASSISLASTLAGGSGLGNPGTASTANIGSAGGGSGNQPLGVGADRDPWHMLHFHVLPLFNGEMLRIPIEDLNELVSKHISNIVARAPARAVATLEHDVESLLARGMVTLNVRVAEVDDTKLIPRLVDTWLLFWHRVLPYVEGIFLPFKTEKPMQSLTKTPRSNRPSSPTMPEETTPITPHPSSHIQHHSIDVRALSLCSFRDSIVQPVYSRLLGLLNAGLGQAQGKDKEKDKSKEKDSYMMFQRIQQMLLVLMSVSHPPLPSSQSQISLLAKSPVLSPDANTPSSLTPTSASRLNSGTSMGSSTGFGANVSNGSSALGIVTTPTSATSPTITPTSSNLSSENTLSLLLNALRNPSSALSNYESRNAQSRISQPFHISRHSSFLSGSGPRDRRGRISARKPTNNDGRAPLELDLKNKSPVTSPLASGRAQYDQWDDETPRNARFKPDSSRSHASFDSPTKERERTHETRGRSRSDGMLDHDMHNGNGRDDESYDEEDENREYEGRASYSDDTRNSSGSQFSSGTTPVPGVGTGQNERGGGAGLPSNGNGTIKRSRRASASEVDGHGNEGAEAWKDRAHIQNAVEKMVGLR